MISGNEASPIKQDRIMMRLKRALLAVTLSALILTSVGIPLQVHAQTAVPPPDVRQLFDSMTPEERVGQLFLVTFTGTDTSQQSQIYDLIANHGIGGVVLSAGNDNFAAAPNTATTAYQLIQSLQEIEWDSAQNSSATPAATPTNPHAYVPLLIAMMQDGDGSPGDQILSGLTPLPSEMAIGATWQTDFANKIGSVMGKELSALGINMYFGPSLDVVDSPNPSASGDLGSSVFGGDPYWVSQMGSAYITGLHAGSQNKILVIAKHFPGEGSSDRSDAEEVATVSKALDQLKQVDLNKLYKIYQTRFANARDFKFFLTGNFSIDTITPLITKYFGSLPSIDRTSAWKDISTKFPAGVTNATLYKGTDPQGMVGIVMSEPFEYNPKNLLELTMLKEIISIKLIEVIREKMSGVYSPQVAISPEHYPSSKFRFIVMFGCAPNAADKLTKAVFAEIKKILKNGPTEVDLNKAKETLIRGRETDLEKNDFWLNRMESLYFDGTDPATILNFKDRVNAVTVKDLKLSADTFIKTDHYVRMVLKPEAK